MTGHDLASPCFKFESPGLSGLRLCLTSPCRPAASTEVSLRSVLHLGFHHASANFTASCEAWGVHTTRRVYFLKIFYCSLSLPHSPSLSPFYLGLRVFHKVQKSCCFVCTALYCTKVRSVPRVCRVGVLGAPTAPQFCTRCMHVGASTNRR
jgi:hypothetical protein